MSIKKCKCKHKQQDNLHGDGKRVHNSTKRTKADGKPYQRCTVCLSEQ